MKKARVEQCVPFNKKERFKKIYIYTYMLLHKIRKDNPKTINNGLCIEGVRGHGEDRQDRG